MADTLENIKKLGAENKIIAAALAALSVAGIVVFLLYSGGPEYQVLYSNLSPEDSGAVIERLKDRKVPYKVSGSAISVPVEKVYETRMELAGDGLPQGGGIGFEIFDKTGFGVTEFVQKVNYKRALQGELARTISQIKEVESARVHLAIPEKGVFLDEQKRTRASIILKLKPNKTLTEGQVAAIVHLAANSFENLKIEDVSVVDTSGRLWTKATGDDASFRLTASQLEYKRSFEKDMEARIQTMLEKTVGANKVVARVSAEIDTKQVERTEETYDPNSQVVRSEQRNKERTVGGVSAIGVPGVLSNMPEGQTPVESAAKPSESQRQDETINYEISKVVNRVVEPIGSTKRLSVSVLIDGTYEASKGPDGKDVKKYAARSEAEIAKFSEMIKAAVGYSEKRGDTVTVISSPFETDFVDAVSEAEKPPLIPPQLLPALIRYASVAVVAVFAILFIVRPLIKKLVGGKDEAPADAHNALTGGLEARHALEGGAERAAAIDALDRMKGIVKDNPQHAAMVLKGWVKEK